MEDLGREIGKFSLCFSSTPTNMQLTMFWLCCFLVFNCFSWGFRAQAQWFANRGYATLQVNYRGSTGYGKSFLHKGDKQWGVGDMQHDLTDSVQWAIDQGIADKDKICIYGGSYGGYACLAGLTFTPDLYACGVDIVGPSNIKTLLDSIPPYWGKFSCLKQWCWRFVGLACSF